MNARRALTLLVGLAGCTPVPAYDQSLRTDTDRLVIVGDFQRTLATEAADGRESNDPERRRLAAAITDLPADAIIVVGDLVSDGASDSEWRYFDDLMSGVRAQHTPVLPALGNHEYWGDDRTVLANVRSRFSALERDTWYFRRHGLLALVWLDTNEAPLGDARWDEQRRWYQATLTELDADPAIRGIVTFGHHPPFTNSLVTDDEENVRDAFVGAYQASPKSIAFVTGHVHAYEHFVIDGKTFLITGGGGGPRVLLGTGPGRRHVDLFDRPSPRPFHYLEVVVTPAGLDVRVMGFAKGETVVDEIDAFSIAYPAP